jgi:gamma-glutamyltranspeptidase/glutathione hydrolase
VLAPGKRMASSMTPTIVVSGGKAVAVVGSPGGDTIPNTVAQVLRNLIDHGMTIDEAIEAGRLHHQYLPDVVRVEQARSPDAAVRAQLTKMGHKLVDNAITLGDANGIVVDLATGIAWGHADSRKAGLALGPSELAPP